MQPSYAQDLGTGSIEHGFYGSMMNALGACIGTIGMIPCCPCPNPFKEVDQGSVGTCSYDLANDRSGQPIRTILQGGRSGIGADQRLLRADSCGGCQDSTLARPEAECPDQGQRLGRSRLGHLLAR